MGKLLLIFDGFDEMADRVDRQKMINNFWELAKVVIDGSKVIVTCRNEHFPEAKEGRALLNAELMASTANLTGEPPQFEILELLKFDDEQIQKLLSMHTDANTVERIMKNKELLDLARRPIMTELILEALPEIEAGKPIDMTRIYFYAVTRKMRRDIKAERTFTSLADKLHFMCEISWEMLSTDSMSLNYRMFPERIRKFFGEAAKEEKDLDHWHYDMMGQTMLIRNEDGDYAPAHRSLLEFFVAYKFVAELGLLSPDFLEPVREHSCVNSSLLPQPYKWASYFYRTTRDDIAPLSSFEPENITYLADNFGRLRITKTILDLMANIIAWDDETSRERLLKIIEACKRRKAEEINFLATNTVLLLIKSNPQILQARNLSELHLEQLDMNILAEGTTYNLIADFSQTSFAHSNLKNFNLGFDSKLSGSDFRNCDLYGLKFMNTPHVDLAIDPTNSFAAISGLYQIALLDLKARKVTRRTLDSRPIWLKFTPDSNEPPRRRDGGVSQNKTHDHSHFEQF